MEVRRGRVSDGQQGDLGDVAGNAEQGRDVG
jgi:hypothetical protein